MPSRHRPRPPAAGATSADSLDITVRQLAQGDLAAAERIRRIAFGTFLGAAEPETFRADTDYAACRWPAPNVTAFGAFDDGELVGSNFVTRWGCVGFFGPLSVRPDLWDAGIGQRLLQPTMETLEGWAVTLAGLYTFPHSTKHVGLYQKFGFRPRFLTAILSKMVPESQSVAGKWLSLSAVPSAERPTLLDECRRLTHGIFAGLDVTGDIEVVQDLKLGDTVLLPGQHGVEGFAVCHCGAGSEAGAGVCYVKFGAVTSGQGAEQRFDALLDACLALAAQHGLQRLAAGINTARSAAYGQMLARGFRADSQGVAMHRPNEPGYSHPAAFVLDDWR